VSSQKQFAKYFSGFGIWLILLLIVAVMGMASDVFLSATNIVNILRQTAIVGILAAGMTFVIIGANIDLSVGATLAFSAVVAIGFQPVTLSSTVLAILIPTVAGAVVGAVNGVLVGYFKFNTFITTMGMQFVVLGGTLLFTGGQHVWVFDSYPIFEKIGNGFIGGVPLSVILLLSVVVLGQFLLSFTNFGQCLKMAGENPVAAKLSGVRVERVIFLSFLIVGFCAGLGGIVLASWVKNMDPGTGIGYEFEAITAVVLGGTGLLGGQGNAANTFAGALILVIIGNAMTLLNISYHYQLMVRGIIIIAAVSLEIASGRKSK
jgi:ribose/xylose/arabinose/galactoside ABC-type transport system permease subunit